MAIGDFLSALPGIGSVASSLLTSSSNVKLAREQREWDYKMWKENNEYNTPAAQVRRLRDAGLNPGISLMNGVIGSGTSNDTAGGQSAPTVDFNPMAQGLRESTDLFQQNQLVKADIRNKDALTESQRIRNKTQLLRDLADLNRIISETSGNYSQKEYMIKQRDYLMKQIDAFDERNTAEVNRINQERALLKEQEETERVMRSVNTQLVQANIKLSKAQTASFNASVKATMESVRQMELNGASQREINSFIRDKEREIARQYNLENTNWYNTYKTRIAKERSETTRNNTTTMFGIPFNLDTSYEIGRGYMPGY